MKLKLNTHFLAAQALIIFAGSANAVLQGSSAIGAAGNISAAGSKTNASIVGEASASGVSYGGSIVQYGGFLQTFVLKPGLDTDNDGLADESDADNDNDGMRDHWEAANNLNALADDAVGDADSDGLSNQQEYWNNTNPRDEDSDKDGMRDIYEVIAGVDPTNPTDYFQIKDLAAGSNDNDVVISWQTVTGRVYALKATTNLLAAWSDIPGYTNIPGAGSAISYTNNDPNSQAGFYRINVRLAE